MRQCESFMNTGGGINENLAKITEVLLRTNVAAKSLENTGGKPCNYVPN